MNLWIIFVIGLTYVAHLKAVRGEFYVNEPILSTDGERIPCGTKFKPNIGVKYQVAYRDASQDEGSFSETSEEEMGANTGRTYPPQARGQIPETLATTSHQTKEEEMDANTVRTYPPQARGQIPETLATTSHQTKDEDKHEHVQETVALTRIEDLPKVQIYEYCFEEKTLSVMYAKYKLDSSKRFTARSLLSRQDSNASSISYDRQVSDMSRIREEPSAARDYYDNQTGYDWQPVGIKEFIELPQLKAAFHRYDVSAPINKELTKPWQELIYEIETKLFKIEEPIHVYSGMYETYRYHGVLMFMNLAARKVKIPFAWWIMLHNEEETQGLSVIMRNYAYSPGENVERLCSRDVCSEVGIKVPEYKRTLIECCPASIINNEYAFTRQNIDGLLNLRR